MVDVSRHIFIIAGPSGAGKTTVVSDLSRTYRTYLEDVSENPYLPDLLRGSNYLDAASNQMWFLDRLAGFARQALLPDVLVLDQHPAAIVDVYGRMLLNDGKLHPKEFASLRVKLAEVEAALHWDKARTSVLFLDAPAPVLRWRVARRRLHDTPSVHWFERLRSCFVDFAKSIPNAIYASTAQLTRQETIHLARTLADEASVPPT